jgi:uncharacterized iron-regulated membrane protein
MYTLLRNIHLYSAFIIASFLLMYFVTGGVMILESAFPRKSKETTLQTVPVEKNDSEEQIIRDLRTRFSIHGDLRITTSRGGNKVYRFLRPGYGAELRRVHVDSVQVSIKEGTIGSVMNDFHRLRGYEGNWIHVLWAFLYDLSCISLLVFSFSGVYLWWKMEKIKKTGVAFLLVSTAITAFTIIYFYQVC